MKFAALKWTLGGMQELVDSDVSDKPTGCVESLVWPECVTRRFSHLSHERARPLFRHARCHLGRRARLCRNATLHTRGECLEPRDQAREGGYPNPEHEHGHLEWIAPLGDEEGASG